MLKWKKVAIHFQHQQLQQQRRLHPLQRRVRQLIVVPCWNLFLDKKKRCS